MELCVILLFCVVLTACILLRFSVLYALLAGLLLFLLYAVYRRFSLREIGAMLLSGVKTTRGILLILLYIGVLTAFWRSAGTIPAIISCAVRLIHPATFLCMTFLLNCAVSVLTGTAFGTAATMGVICMTMGSAMRLSPAMLGGAILAGSFFGDRCSPVSTSALLVCEVTGTDIYRNIRHMLRTALVPFLAACGVYLVLGVVSPHSAGSVDVVSVFSAEFSLHPVTLLPAAVILVLSLFRVNVKISMPVSIVSAFFVSLFLQHTPLLELVKQAFLGYSAQGEELAGMLNGGGIFSMLSVMAIVCISAMYIGIFEKTGLLQPAKRGIRRLGERTTPYLAYLFTAALTSMITCNQTLSIMLTEELCASPEEPKETTAVLLENSAVIISTLIPWAIGATVPLSSVGAPLTSILFAFFISFLPLWCIFVSFSKKRKQVKAASAV